MKNVGTDTLTGILLSRTGNGFAYDVITPPPASLAPGQSATLVVSFTPPWPGDPVNATLLIASNDPDENPFDIKVTGTGVNAPIAFVTAPRSRLVTPGTDIDMNVEARGEPPLKYQWRKNGANITGATATSYRIENASLANAGGYSVLVKAKIASAVSAIAEIGVVDQTAKSLVLGKGATVTFSIAAAGNGLTFLWYKNGEVIENSARIRGATGRMLTVSSLELGDEGSYYCRVQGPGGMVWGGANNLIVVDLAPQIVNADPEASPNDPIVMPDAMVGRAYYFNITVAEGDERTPSRFSAIGLPAGLTIDAATGAVGGKPTVSRATPYQISLIAANAKGTSITKATLMVAPLPQELAGTYVAAVGRDPLQNGDLGDFGGRLDLVVTAAASFSGRLKLGATVYPIKGVLDAETETDSVGTVTLTRNQLPPLQMQFFISRSAAKITGSVNDGGDGIGAASLSGWRQVWHATRNAPGTRSGRHVFGLDTDSAFAGSASIPQGSGFGTISIDLSGNVTLTGSLPDGTSISSHAPLGPQGEVLLYSPLHTNSGSIVGQFQIAADSFHTITGNADWLKRPLGGAQTLMAQRNYKSGFGPLSLTAAGGAYVPLSPGQIVMGLSDQTGNARLVFSEGGIASAERNPNVTLRITTAHTVVMPTAASGENPAKTTLSLQTASRQFTGTFELSDVPPGLIRPVIRQGSFRGVIVPSNGGQDRGYGYFLLPALPDSTATVPTNLATAPIFTGQVILEPAG